MPQRLVLSSFFLILISVSASAQERFHSPDYLLYQNLRLTGEADGYEGGFNSYSTNAWETDAESLWQSTLYRRPFMLVDGEMKLSFSVLSLDYSLNTGLPYGYYDQAQWQGKGSNLNMEAGLVLDWKGLKVTLEGQFWYAENRSFDTVDGHNGQPAHEYWYYDGGTIDYYQQPSSPNAWGFSPGQSGIRYTADYWTVGFSTENIWIGPSRFFPIMLSDQAAGFPHLDLGTPGYVPVTIKDVRLGLLETRFTLGLLSESDYFDSDTDDTNDYNQFFGFTLGYAFPFQENLKFGLNYYRRKNLDDFPSNFWQVLNITNKDTDGSSSDSDVQLSLTLAWLFESIGLEVYGEYARNDYAPDFETLLKRLDKSNGYTFGLEKTFRMKSSDRLSFIFEFSDLFQIPYDERQNEPQWYKHYGVPQGHTNEGQLLGNPIGPGSDSQILAVRYFRPHCIWDGSMQRVFVDKDYFFDLTTDPNTLAGDENWAKFIFTVKRTQLSHLFDWYVEAAYIAELGYGWDPDTNIHNFHLGAGMSY